ncbi:fibroblast growth factor-binding protein 1-like [Ochotona curzoniae]|uniref:fibroblast growth factor-binding protein 1-like n=1 Tax=Ochotona curzoniae TaxID=130825 RepID=UPI001B34C489|nr:fibroblast growth factor-binding protein 1-like [Ochotona curzoniae]
MKTHSLTLLSVLLLAAQALPTEPQQEAEFEYLQPSGDGWVTLGKPVMVATIPTTNVIVTGHFNRDQAKCNVTVTSQEKGVLLQVDCVRFSHEFSCVFGGDPTACLRCVKNDKVYWRQIGWRLRHLEHICEDSRAILDTRVCSAKYPESNLKLLSSTLARKLPPLK